MKMPTPRPPPWTKCPQRARSSRKTRGKGGARPLPLRRRRPSGQLPYGDKFSHANLVQQALLHPSRCALLPHILAARHSPAQLGVTVDDEHQRVAAELIDIARRTVHTVGRKVGTLEGEPVGLAGDGRQVTAIVEHILVHLLAEQPPATAAGIENEHK